MAILWQVALPHPDEPATFPTLRPHRLPEGVIDIPLKEVDVPVVGDLDAGVVRKFEMILTSTPRAYKLLAKECRSACRPRCSTPAASQAVSIVASRFRLLRCLPVWVANT